jgi:hypothetical protein
LRASWFFEGTQVAMGLRGGSGAQAASVMSAMQVRSHGAARMWSWRNPSHISFLPIA